MQAAVYYAPGDIRIEERPEPSPTADNLILEVSCCAICGSDLKLARLGSARIRPPRIIGHELAGRITYVGSRVTGFAVGERVTLATTIGCGRCQLCLRGLSNLCPNAIRISNDVDGGFAEKLAVPPQALAGGNVIKLPAKVSDEAAALSEPLSCAINAQELAEVKAGDRVLILGGGPLGALHAELAKARGAAEVMVVQRSQPRLLLLRQLKDVVVIDGVHEDVAAIVRERTEGLGADAVLVCAPTREAHEMAFGLARKGGTISLFASLPANAAQISLNSRTVHYGELRIVGSSDSRPEHVRQAVSLLAAGRIDASVIITHRLPLASLHEGLALMQAKQSLKVLLYPPQR